MNGRLVDGAWWGLAAGALVGLAEAAVGWGGGEVSPVSFFVGPLLDGAVGALAGAAVARLLGAPGRGLAPRLAGASLALGLALAGLLPGPATALVGEQREGMRRRDVLWVLVEGVEAGVAYEAGLTALAPVQGRTVKLATVRSGEDQPDVALASLLTGRLPVGHGAGPYGAPAEGVPTFVSVFERAGYATAVVSHAGVRGWEGADRLERLSARAVRGAGLDGLALVRGVNALIGVSDEQRVGVPAARVVEAASLALEQAPAEPLALAVHLRDPWMLDQAADDDPAARAEARAAGWQRVDAAIGPLVAAWVRARGEDAMVFVTGVGGAVPRDSDPVAWGPARQVPWWVVFPTSAGVAGVEVPELARTIDVLPSLGSVAGDSDMATVVDGEPLLQRIAWSLKDPNRNGPLAVGADPCDAVHRRQGVLRSVENAWRGGEIVERAVVGEGFVVVEGERGARLFNLVEDPTLSALPVRETALTCGGVMGADRIKAYGEVRELAEVRSGGLLGTGLSARPEGGLEREDLPVPRRYR